MTTEQKKTGKVRMRLDGCVKIIKDMGPASVKQVGNALGYSDIWAAPFLKMGVATGELMVVRNKRPQLYDLPPEERGVEVQRPIDTTPTEFTITLPKNVLDSLKAMAYMYETTEADILEQLIHKEVNKIERCNSIR